MGVPMKEGSLSSDPIIPETPDHEPVPPTPEQTATVNNMYEKYVLNRNDVPAGFGEGLDRLASESDERMQRPGS